MTTLMTLIIILLSVITAELIRKDMKETKEMLNALIENKYEEDQE